MKKIESEKTKIAQRQHSFRQTIWKVVITGGPCGGKSTGMVSIREALMKKGFQVLVVPEAATLLLEGGGGSMLENADDEAIINFQIDLLYLQLSLEDRMVSIAQNSGKKTVILCDRGTMDGKAFCSEEMWQEIINRTGYDSDRLRDTRYDMVLHLVTAAEGAGEFYTTVNNKVRTETPEQAIEQDNKLKNAYVGHPHISVVDNENSFVVKMNRCIEIIFRLVGLEGSPGVYLKYRLEGTPADEDIPVPCTKNTVVIHILRGSTKKLVLRLYKRFNGSSEIWIYQQIIRENGVLISRVEERLTHAAYLMLLEQAEPLHKELVKKNVSFIYENQYFEIGSPSNGCGESFLYVEQENLAKKPVRLPPFLSKFKPVAVTDNPDYSSFSLSLVPTGTPISCPLDARHCNPIVL
eukprot:TRINITY_DN16732_c1_g1_i1.p1 TRINITY_DN16732_c1_g1~~TRINITY_DN16732_c1_g1_i1.p1  ORF type:complete len:451 (+),score=75.12 TRINITY_DN16732_c1_g1_i1:132-1355(+)